MAKITLSPEAKKLVASLRSRIAELETEVETLKARRAGMRSDGIEDRYTAMDAAELRALVIKRGGDPDEIVEGLHSRQRSIKMREWLRAHPARKSEDAKPAKASAKKYSGAPVRKVGTQKKTAKPEKRTKRRSM